MEARLPLRLGAAAALLALLALLAVSGSASSVGEAIEVHPPHVMEGGAFQANVTMPSVGEPAGVQVKVSCASCGSGWTTPALTNWRQVAPGQWRKEVTFPGPLFGGSAGQPIWAQNYTVRLVGGLAQANVTVHAIDDWLQPNGTYEVTEAVRFRVAGVPAGDVAHINISKWNRAGALVPVRELRVAASNGVAEYDWRIPREHAADMTCSAAGKCRDYTATIKAGSKTERVEWRAAPARLAGSIVYLITDERGEPLLPLGPGPLVFNRTENVTVRAEVRYHDGAMMGYADRTLAGNATLDGTLRLAVERVTVATDPTGNQTQTFLDRVATLQAKATATGWRAAWTIPKNLSTTQAGPENPQYRVRLLAQEDRWGNDITDANGTGFRVYPLRIVAKAVTVPHGQVERGTNASAIFNLHYADGTPFTNTTNASAMRASLVDEEGDPVASATLRYLGGGSWAVSYKPGIRQKVLGYHQLRIHENQDADGNELLETDTELFEIVPARPRVDLVTKVGGEPRNATQGFARGDRIRVEATIRYPDGTPFNASRLPDGVDRVAINVTKLDARGEPRGWDLLGLEPADDLGHWGTNYQIKDLDDDAPLGAWAWRIRVEDRESPANLNDTTLVRAVRGAGIEVELRRHPEPLVRATDSVTIRFHARYPHPDGRVVDEALAASGLAVTVHPWSEGRTGAPIARLYPTYDEDRQEWLAVWHTNRTTLVGDYVIGIAGHDVFGNLFPSTTTRVVTVFVDQLQRQVLVDAPEKARRGEVVLVVFDGAEGDIGEVGFDAPRIELQKWNPLRQAWEKERTDVRVPGNGTLDHTGRIETDITTNLGQYRFALFARNDQLAMVNATSRVFRVLPMEVERPWTSAALNATLGPITKGTPLTLSLERRDGDRVDNVGVFKDGARVANATSLLKPGRFEVQWRTSFGLADGVYQLVVRGRDIHNNSLASPPLPLNLTGVALEARVPSPPQAAIQRADRLELRALIQYPDSVHAKSGAFQGRLLRDGELVAVRDLTLNRSSWLFNWTPPADAPIGRYSVVVRGDDGLGNAVRDDEVFSFQLAEGVLDRTFTFQRNVANRTDNVAWVLPAQPSDTTMRFVLRDDAGARRELPYETTATGDYVVRWKPAKDEKLTRYTLEAQGADQGGNAVLATSRSLVLKPAPLAVAWLEQPGRTLKPGETGRWVFQLLYPDGTPLPADAANLPLVGIVGGGEKLVEPTPSLEPLGADRWLATWTPVAGKHTGAFKLVVGGKDQHGNVIPAVNAASGTFRLDEGLFTDVLRSVPGPEAALLPLALLGAALLARRRQG